MLPFELAEALASDLVKNHETRRVRNRGDQLQEFIAAYGESGALMKLCSPSPRFRCRR